MFAYFGIGPQELILLLTVGLMIAGGVFAVLHALTARRSPALPEGATAEEIASVATAGDLPEAELWREALEREGIRCRVIGEYLGGFGVVYHGTPVPEIWVLQKDAGRAREILKQLRLGSEPTGSR